MRSRRPVPAIPEATWSVPEERLRQTLSTPVDGPAAAMVSGDQPSCQRP